jgi:hypothetical protein
MAHQPLAAFGAIIASYPRVESRVNLTGFIQEAIQDCTKGQVINLSFLFGAILIFSPVYCQIAWVMIRGGIFKIRRPTWL